MRIHHFAFEVSDLEASIQFYEQLLGFKLQLRARDAENHEEFAMLDLDGGRLELVQALSETNAPRPFQPVVVRDHYCPHLALQVDDMDRALAALKARGIPVAHGPLEAPGAARWAYFCDPDRNVVEFFQDLSKPG